MKPKAKLGVEPSGVQGADCLQGLAAVIQQGIKDGTFSPSVDAWTAATVGWAASNGVLLLFDAGRTHQTPGLDVQDLLRVTTELWIRGLKARD